MKTDLTQYHLYLSNIYFNDGKFFLKSLNNANSYRLSIIFNDDSLKDSIGSNILNSQQDQFFFGKINFKLKSVSIHSFIFDFSKFSSISRNVEEFSLTFTLRLKTPVLINNHSLIAGSNKINFTNLIDLLSSRLQYFNLALKSFFPVMKEINSYDLSIESYNLRGLTISEGFGIIGWIRITIEDDYDFFRQFFYYIAFFGLGPGGDSGFGFADVLGLDIDL